MMMIRWTQEAGADMRSVFLCNTNTAEATTEALVALQKKIHYPGSSCPIQLVEYLQCWSQKFNSFGSPQTSSQSVEKPHESIAIAFDGSDDDHHQVSIGKQFGCVSNSIMYLFGSVDFFQGFAHHFDRQEFHHFISNVEWQVENDVPVIKATKIEFEFPANFKFAENFMENTAI